MSTKTIDEFLQALKTLSVDCNFQQISAEEHRDQCIRDAFVQGICSDFIRQRLLESRNLNLETAFDKASALETACEHSKSYASTETEQFTSNATAAISRKSFNITSAQSSAAKSSELKCYFCGNDKHSRTVCPAREAICFYREKVGHFAKVCNKMKASSPVDNAATKVAASVTPHLTQATISNNVSSSLTKAAAPATINKTGVKTFFDCCSAKSYVNPSFAKELKN